MKSHSRSAFTLLELLLSTAIVALLVCLSLAGFSKLIEANAIGTGAQMVRDCLDEARQDAVTQNTTVEVRVYSSPGGSGYSALQIHARNADGTMPAVALPLFLPVGAVIDGTAEHSSLVASTGRPAPDSADFRLDANTRCFHFLPNGATDLSAPGPWTLTVRAAGSSDPSHFPSNWACISLDPITGRAQVYRP